MSSKKLQTVLPFQNNFFFLYFIIDFLRLFQQKRENEPYYLQISLTLLLLCGKKIDTKN